MTWWRRPAPAAPPVRRPDPELVALRALEARTGVRAPYANPLTALRWLEQHTGTPPHMFGVHPFG